MATVTLLNPHTCGIYKDGGARYQIDPATGRRTAVLDNELLEHVNAYLNNEHPAGSAELPLETIFNRQVLVPTYYDPRYSEAILELLRRENLKGVTLGDLMERGHVRVRGGHGSPGNDQRSGHIPYVKVSDVRGLRININPTNLVTEVVAQRYWRGKNSGLQAWDLITPNRASSNIGEFAVLLPGEEQVVLTKEVFVLRVSEQAPFDCFYLLWALSLQAVRDQWRRVALMQTNREDCGQRYREVLLPEPPSREWADGVSQAFRTYFQTVARAKISFIEAIQSSRFAHIANVSATVPVVSDDEDCSEDAGAPGAA